MATPEVTVDGTTEYEAANMNKYISAGGTKLNVAVRYARIRSNGVSLEVSTATDNAILVMGDLTFNAGTDSIDITLSGLTNPPLIIPVPATPTAYFPQIDSATLTNIFARILFFDRADISSQASVAVSDTDMDLNLYIIGE